MRFSFTAFGVGRESPGLEGWQLYGTLWSLGPRPQELNPVTSSDLERKQRDG